MSDLHGEYEKYAAMLKKINFGESDVLYVLGDVVDRGPEPVKILLDMSMRPNVYPIIGNHEAMALPLLKTLSVEITENNYNTQITPEVMSMLYHWQRNGGQATLDAFRAVDNRTRLELIEYIEEFARYEALELGGVCFILVHAGLGNYSPSKKLRDYTLDELTWTRSATDEIYYGDDVRVVVGHTPTGYLTGEPKILYEGNRIYIDCGAAYGGALACLCLDTMEEFYI